MSTLKDLTDLWGRELVAEIRHRFPTPKDLPNADDCEKIYDLLIANGCQLARPTRSRPVKNIIEDLVDGQDPIYTGEQPIGPSGPIESTESKLALSDMEKLRAELELEKYKLQQAVQAEEIKRLKEEIQSLRLKRETIEGSSKSSDRSSVASVPPPVPTAPTMALGKSIKLLMELIPPVERFAGQDDRSIVEDLLIFEELCKSNNIPQDQWAKILVYILKGDARRFFRSQPARLQFDYEQIKQALIDRYLSPEKLDRIKMQYNDLTLKDCGSLEKYGEELLRLYKHLPEGYATEAALIDKLILGIGQEDVTRQYRTIRPKTYAAAMELVRVWTKAPRRGAKLLYADQSEKHPQIKKKSTKKPTRAAPKKALNIPQNAFCHNCGKTGHYASRCQKPRVLRCGLCGMIGHFTRQCPSLPEELRAKFDNLYSKNLPVSKEITPASTPSSESATTSALEQQESSKN